MKSARRFLVWFINNKLRYHSQFLNLNCILFVFLISFSFTLIILGVTGSFEYNELDQQDSTSLSNSNFKKIEFLPPDPNFKPIYKPITVKEPLKDNILSTFNEKAVKKGNEISKPPLKESLKGDIKAGSKQSEKITQSEEDFFDDEEFVPPTNYGKTFESLGSAMKNIFQSFKGENDADSPLGSIGGILLNAVKNSAGGSSDGMEDKSGPPLSKILSAVRTMAQIRQAFQGGSSVGRKSVFDEKNQDGKLSTGDAKNSPSVSNLNSALPSYNNGDAKRKKTTTKWQKDKASVNGNQKKKFSKGNSPYPNPPSWIMDALNDPKRNQSVQNIENIYDIIERRHKVKAGQCDNIETVGGKMKQSKFDPNVAQLLCKDPDFGNAFTKGCIVYSFAINGSWEFENAIAEKGCKVWLFDEVRRVKLSNASSNIKFNNVGLGAKNEIKIINSQEVQFHTLQTIITKLKHDKSIISYLKLNLNGDEWPVLDQIITKNPLLSNNILQIGVTTHLHTALVDFGLYEQYENVLERLTSLGFQMFSSRKVENVNDVYVDPLLQNKTVSLTNYLAYIKL